MQQPQRPAQERIRDPNPEVRYRAVMELEPEAIEPLMQGLSDESWRVRKAAIERLVALPEPGRIVDALIERLAYEDDAGARNAAAEALARIGTPAVPALSLRLAKGDCDVRKLAADVLGESGAQAAIPALIGALRDPDQNVRAACAEALGKLGGAEAAGALEAALAVDDPLMRLAALDALAKIGSTPPIGVLAPLARERFLRRAVLRLLGSVPGRASLEIIADGLASASRGTREEAFAALGAQLRSGLEKPQALLNAVSAIVTHRSRLAALARDALGFANAQAAEGAVRLLGLCGEPADAAAIASAAVEEPLRDPAVAALQSLGAPAGAALLKALPELQPEARLVAIEALARLRERSALPQLVQLAREGAEAERLAAIEALGALGETAAIEPLLELLRGGDLAGPAAEALVAVGRADRAAVQRAVRAELAGPAAPWAMRVLGTVGEHEDLPLLKAALRSERTEVRLAATEAALALGQSGTEEMLRIALADEAPEVRAGAARGLAGFPSEESFTALAAALEDREPAVAAAAAEALGRLGDRRAVGPLSRLLSRGERNPGSPEVLPAVCAVRALARLGGASPEALLTAAAHPDPEVIKEAIEAATALPDAGQVLLIAARHPRWDVRRAAARAIGMRGDRALLTAVRGLAATEPDELVAQAFFEAQRALEARPPTGDRC